MKQLLALEFVLYGLLLAGVSWLIHETAPAVGRVTWVTGVSGGSLAVLWGMLVLCGHRRRGWMVLVLAAVSFALLTQAVAGWTAPAGAGDAAPPLKVTVWITGLLALSFGMLMNLLHGQGRRLAEPDAAASRPAAEPSARDTPRVATR